MTQATTQDSITSQTIAVEHIRISSGRSFVEVLRKLEGTVPKLDPGIAEVTCRRVTKPSQSLPATGLFCGLGNLSFFIVLLEHRFEFIFERARRNSELAKSRQVI